MEKQRFEEGITLFGKNWQKIAEYVSTKSVLQVRSHSQKYLKKFPDREQIQPHFEIVNDQLEKEEEKMRATVDEICQFIDGKLSQKDCESQHIINGYLQQIQATFQPEYEEKNKTRFEGTVELNKSSCVVGEAEPVPLNPLFVGI